MAVTVRNTLTGQEFSVQTIAGKSSKQVIEGAGIVQGGFTVRSSDGGGVDDVSCASLEGSVVNIGLPYGVPSHQDPAAALQYGGSMDNTKSSSWIPKLSHACRCKEQIDARQVIALMHVKDVLRNLRPTGKQRDFLWLDIGCGRGSILGQVPYILGRDAKSVRYVGTDLDKSYVSECKSAIRGLGNQIGDSSRAFVSDIAGKRLDTEERQFDYVTILNVLHEIPPSALFNLFASAIERCKRGGAVTIIDMGELPHLERHAIPWPAKMLRRLVSPLLRPEFRGRSGPEYVAKYWRRVQVVEMTIPKRSFDTEALRKRRREVSGRFSRNTRVLLHELRRSYEVSISSALEKLDQKTTPESTLDQIENKLARDMWEHLAVCQALASRF